MNFLAHLYLSGNNEEVKVGNFIADWVKGKNYMKYPEHIQRGILMHRAIDSFTDTHAIAKQTRMLYYDSYGKYAGIVTDIVYDHFLSWYWDEYSNFDRLYFINQAHDILHRYRVFAPGRSQHILPSLIYHRWMDCYISFPGLERVLSRMATRTTLPPMSKTAITILREHYNDIEQQFRLFFDELRVYVNEHFEV